MTRVRMRLLAAGPFGVLQAGSVREIDPDLADQLIEAGAAELVTPAAVEETAPVTTIHGDAGESGGSQPESATNPAPETTAQPTPSRKNPSKSRRRRS
ncbi:MAG: hypothetical protein HW375_45 [Anaerolineales bacterium]|nr:hypothetical protein [Anaerolineales bacterium]